MTSTRYYTLTLFLNRILTINLSNCKYDSGKLAFAQQIEPPCFTFNIFLVCRVARKFGLRPVGEDDDWTVFWTDTSVLLERVMEMKRYQVRRTLSVKLDGHYCYVLAQKINHFPGMIEICRKDLLARNMNRMLKIFPKEYNIFPRSWCLPAE